MWHAFGVRSGASMARVGRPGRQEATMSEKRKVNDEEREEAVRRIASASRTLRSSC
jgi:hypothetical protein